MGNETSVEAKKGVTVKVLAIVCVVALVFGCILGYAVNYLMTMPKIEALQGELGTAYDTIASLEDETTRLEDEISRLQITPEEYTEKALTIGQQGASVMVEYANYLDDYGDGDISRSQALTKFRVSYDSFSLLFAEATKLQIADGYKDAHTHLLRGMAFILVSLDLAIQGVEKLSTSLLDASMIYLTKGTDEMTYARTLLS